MKSSSILLTAVAAVAGPLFVQPVAAADILTFTSEWEYLLHTDGAGNQVDPATVDPDFYDTWHQQAPVYNGPAFTGPTPGPFAYGVIDYFTNNAIVPTSLGAVPANGTRGTVYFKTEIDFGPNSLTEVQIEMLRDDAFILFLDGNMITPYLSDNMGVINTQWNNLAASVGDETQTFTFGFGTGTPLADIGPGPHTLALTVHQQSGTSSDLGMAMRLSGTLVPVPEPSVAATGLLVLGGLLNRRRR